MEDIINVNFIIDGTRTLMPIKMVYEQADEDETKNIHYEIDMENNYFIADSSDVTEIAVTNLRKALPPDISIACCQSCRHANFNPYGDNDNEVFCLKGFTPNNKNDVCEIFSNGYNSLKAKSRKLLDYCSEFKPISHNDYYTYNDWGLY